MRGRIHDVRRHDRGQPLLDQRGERHDVGAQDVVERARVDRRVDVRIRGDEAVAGKVLADGGAARGCEATHERGREIGDHDRIGMERAIADHRARRIVEVEHRREAEVDAVRAQLAGDRRAMRERGVARRRRLELEALAERAHGRDRGELAGAKALDAAAFVVDRDEEHRPQRADFRRERAQLRRRFEVAREQDDATDAWIGEACAIAVREG